MASEARPLLRGGCHIRRAITALGLSAGIASCAIVSGFDDLAFDLPAGVAGQGGGTGGEGGTDSCTSGDECSSGFCANGICCDRACDDACEACALAGLEGICSPLNALETPPACDGTCDGAGQCASGDVTWALQLGSMEDQYVNAIAVDSADNIIVVGEFSDTLDFGDASRTGNEDGFVWKLDSEGTPIWSYQFDVNGDVEVRDVAVDPNDDILLAVELNGNITVGPDFFQSESGGSDILLVKLDSEGEVQLARKFGQFSTDTPYAVTSDDSGNILIAGSFNSQLDFGSGALPRFGSVDAFVAMLDPSGNHLWSKSAGGNQFDGVLDVVARGTVSDSTVHFAGYFNNTIDFGAGSLNAEDRQEGFIVQADELGTASWQVGLIGMDDQNVRHIALGSDALFAGGTFESQGLLVDTPLTSAGDDDVFLARMSDSGAVVWAKRFGGDTREWLGGLDVDASDNVVAVGLFVQGLDFGGEMLAGAGDDDVFVAKLSGDGEHLWSQRFGFAGSQVGQAVAIDSKGAVIVGGAFEDSILLGDDQFTSMGLADVFLVKLSP